MRSDQRLTGCPWAAEEVKRLQHALQSAEKRVRAFYHSRAGMCAGACRSLPRATSSKVLFPSASKKKGCRQPHAISFALPAVVVRPCWCVQSISDLLGMHEAGLTIVGDSDQRRRAEAAASDNVPRLSNATHLDLILMDQDMFRDVPAACTPHSFRSAELDVPFQDGYLSPGRLSDVPDAETPLSCRSLLRHANSDPIVGASATHAAIAGDVCTAMEAIAATKTAMEDAARFVREDEAARARAEEEERLKREAEGRARKHEQQERLRREAEERARKQEQQERLRREAEKRAKMKEVGSSAFDTAAVSAPATMEDSGGGETAKQKSKDTPGGSDDGSLIHRLSESVSLSAIGEELEVGAGPLISQLCASIALSPSKVRDGEAVDFSDDTRAEGKNTMKGYSAGDECGGLLPQLNLPAAADVTSTKHAQYHRSNPEEVSLDCGGDSSGYLVEFEGIRADFSDWAEIPEIETQNTFRTDDHAEEEHRAWPSGASTCTMDVQNDWAHLPVMQTASSLENSVRSVQHEGETVQTGSQSSRPAQSSAQPAAADDLGEDLKWLEAEANHEDVRDTVAHIPWLGIRPSCGNLPLCVSQQTSQPASRYSMAFVR